MAGMRFLEDWEVEKFLDTAKTAFTWQSSQRFWAMAALQFATGLRANEIITLVVGNVSADCVHCNQWVTVRKRNMKGKREGRSIPASPMAIRAVEAWLQLSKPSSIHRLLFPTYENGANRFSEKEHTENSVHPANYTHYWEKVARMAGLEPPVCSHSARKTFAKRFYEASNHNIYATSRALGHTNIATTMAYLSCSDDLLNNTIRALFQ